MRGTITRIGKNALGILLYYSGGVYCFRKLRQWLGLSRLTILAYHGVGDETPYIDLFVSVDKFEGQLRHLRKHYRVISMAEAEEVVRRPATLREDLIALTFDDGYRDNYESAFPLLRRYGLSATVYLTTRCIDTGEPTFVYFLILAIHYTRKPSVDLSARGLGILELTSFESREAAVRQIDQYAQPLSFPERERLLDELLVQLGLHRDLPLFKDRMLTWDQVREMHAHDISFGAHTVTHPVLASRTDQEVDAEVRESKVVIEKALGGKVDLFAYTYGGRKHINAGVVNAVRRAGFSSAVVLYRQRGSDLFTLGRTMISDDMTSNFRGSFSRSVFACEMSGLFDVVFVRSRVTDD